VHVQLAERALANGGNWRLLEAVAASLHYRKPSTSNSSSTSSSTAAEFIAALLSQDMAYLNALLVSLVGLLLIGLPQAGNGITQVHMYTYKSINQFLTYISISCA
jgi:hypothetical protein